MTQDYFIGVHARELERLRDQHAAWQPETQALWLRAGFDRATHIADLGSGPGFTAFDLARLAAAPRTVTAVDKAAPYLAFVESESRKLGLGNVRTHECDVARSA